MVLDVTIFYSINEINGLTIGLEIYARGIGCSRTSVFEQLTAMGWCYVAGDLDNRRGREDIQGPVTPQSGPS